LKYLEKYRGVELTFLPCDEDGYIEPGDFVNAIKDNTALVVFSHCSNVTGSVLDLENIIKYIKFKRNIPILVDASQSAGCISIDVEKSNIDMLAFTGHKFLYGFRGIGGLYLKKGLDIKPLMYGGTGIYSELLEQPQERPLYYESGTPNILGIESLKAGIRYLATYQKGLEEKKKNIVKKILEFFNSDNRIQIYGHKKGNSASLISFNVSGFLPEDIGYMLENEKIIIRAGLHCAPLIHQYLNASDGTVRISPSSFTKEDEIDKFIDVIKRILVN